MNLNTQKVVAHPETGQVITLFNKMSATGEEKIYGRVRIDETTLVLNDGFIRPQRRTAFVTLDEAAMQILTPYIKEGNPYPMEGKVVVKESLKPHYEGQTPKINPTTEDYVLCDGQYVYRTTEFTTNLEAKDELIQATTESTVDLETQVIRDELVM
jgi:hypothetical protein